MGVNNEENVLPGHPTTDGLSRAGSEAYRYKISVEGLLDEGWSAWLGGVEISHQLEGYSQLVGVLPDQAALYSILLQLRDLGLPLISLQMLEADR